MLVFLQSFWWFLVLIGIMILLHELGHYSVARFFDVKVEAFSFGFGPRLFGIRRGETDFRFCAFLIGGYVKMAGEQPGEEGADDPRAFPNKPRWQRLLIVFAGPFVNMVLAVVILAGLFMYQYPSVPNPNSPRVGYLLADGAAAEAGLMEGDQIIEIQGTVDPTWEDVAIAEIAGAGRPLDVWVMRDGERLHFNVTPNYDEQQGMGTAGWSPEAEVQVGGYCCGVDAAEEAGLQTGDTFVTVNGQPIRSSVRLTEILGAGDGEPVDVVYSRGGREYQATIQPERADADGEERWLIGVALQQRVDIVQLGFVDAVRESLRQNRLNATVMYQILRGMVEQRMSAKNVAGPIGIAQMSGEAARQGADSYLRLMAVVSLNLAVVNLLPIPLLDGGTILMLLIEMLMRRDLDLRVKEAVVKVGLVFLMLMIVFVIYNDISRLLPSG